MKTYNIDVGAFVHFFHNTQTICLAYHVPSNTITIKTILVNVCVDVVIMKLAQEWF